QLREVTEKIDRGQLLMRSSKQTALAANSINGSEPQPDSNLRCWTSRKGYVLDPRYPAGAAGNNAACPRSPLARGGIGWDCGDERMKDTAWAVPFERLAMVMVMCGAVITSAPHAVLPEPSQLKFVRKLGYCGKKDPFRSVPISAKTPAELAPVAVKENPLSD